MPSFSAAHSPSSLLRRAFALKRSSSSWANFFSKPSSRLSKVVMLASLTDVWDSDKSCLAYREEIHKSTWQKRGNGAASNERACGDCAPHSDPLGCPDG